MGKKGKKETPSKTKPSQKQQQHSHDNSTMLWVDPDRIRFQHSRIRPCFSSCGRTLMETLNSIRNGEITPQDLPPIQHSE